MHTQAQHANTDAQAHTCMRAYVHMLMHCAHRDRTDGDSYAVRKPPAILARKNYKERFQEAYRHCKPSVQMHIEPELTCLMCHIFAVAY